VAESELESCGRDALAGKAAGDDIDGSSSSCPDSSDIVEDGDAGEAEFEDRTSPRIDLAEPGVPEPCEVQPVGEHPDAVELAADGERSSAIQALTPDSNSTIRPRATFPFFSAVWRRTE
jgi:hypothetical protein